MRCSPVTGVNGDLAVPSTIKNLNMNNIHIVKDPHELTQVAGQLFYKKAQSAIKNRGRFSVALSGGSTPKRLYQHLADEYAERINWNQVHLFWGDERNVAPDHEDSNFLMTVETLLRRLPIPPNIYRVKGENAPDSAAKQYENEILNFFGKNKVVFDLIFLGMGDDGHTASLFPESKALDISDRWVIENYVEKMNAWRITFTTKTINAARDIVFLISGIGKAEMLKNVLETQSIIVPSQMIQPSKGKLLWLIDEAAASELSKKQSRSDF